MQMRIRKTSVLAVVIIGLALLQCGCSAQKAQETGFLNDYSKLKPYSDVSYQYALTADVIKPYSKVIIDPVEVHFHASSKATKDSEKGKIKEQDIEDLCNYLHASVEQALSKSFTIVYRPGPGVMRMRMALTDLKKANILMNIHPASKLIGKGIGGASVEAELIDSQSGEQLAAIIESQLGKRVSLSGLSAWGDAKSVMDEWAERLRNKIVELQ